MIISLRQRKIKEMKTLEDGGGGKGNGKGKREVKGE
jgi:hypothetical protein